VLTTRERRDGRGTLRSERARRQGMGWGWCLSHRVGFWNSGAATMRMDPAMRWVVFGSRMMASHAWVHANVMVAIIVDRKSTMLPSELLTAVSMDEPVMPATHKGCAWPMQQFSTNVQTCACTEWCAVAPQRQDRSR
jgi:hypothetical protein